MKALAFSEHGSVFEWYHKKCKIEAAGMKYVHAVEAYLTESLEEKIRDNYHCVLIAKNYKGFKELNRLVSRSFCRTDNHYYYAPRISFEELFNTSKNIIITTACIGGVLGKGEADTQEKFIKFLDKNKDRCYLEIGHHHDNKQKEYNLKLYDLHKKYNIPLISGTDTHVLDEVHEEGRKILQISKNINFDGEDNWDLKFHSYEQLIEEYRNQICLPMEVIEEAIENTNILADSIEEFSLNKDTKYPHIYDNPYETFMNKINEAVLKHPYALLNHTKEEIDSAIQMELEVYEKTKSIDFMLMQTYIREWEELNGIHCGYGRGSVSGSFIAYLLGVTQMDSLRFNLNFFRFLNPSRVTNSDIDTDYSGVDRDKVKSFLLKDRMNLPQIKTAEIITFNTIALKGAIKDVGRALGMELKEAQKISDAVVLVNGKWVIDETIRKKHPELFRYVDIVNGTIVSVGTHPSGVLVSDLDIEEEIGMCSIGSTEYQVSMLNMKELDDLMYVKLSK